MKELEKIIEYITSEEGKYEYGRQEIRVRQRSCDILDDEYDALQYELGRIMEGLAILKGIKNKVNSILSNKTNISNLSDFSNKSITGNDIDITYKLV